VKEYGHVCRICKGEVWCRASSDLARHVVNMTAGTIATHYRDAHDTALTIWQCATMVDVRNVR
jgi:hypothetical protein